MRSDNCDDGDYDVVVVAVAVATTINDDDDDVDDDSSFGIERQNLYLPLDSFRFYLQFVRLSDCLTACLVGNG